MVKKSRLLDEVEAEAQVPYEETRLAREAARVRPRLALLLALGAAGLALEAAVQGSALWLVPAVAVALAGWGVRAGRLGGVIAAGLSAVLAVALPLRLLFVGEHDAADYVAMAASVAWGVAMLPGVVTLLRDAELQHAYGLWARR